MIEVYAIVSGKNGEIYVGMATNAEKRLKEHNDYITWTAIGGFLCVCGAFGIDDFICWKMFQPHFYSGLIYWI